MTMNPRSLYNPECHWPRAQKLGYTMDSMCRRRILLTTRHRVGQLGRGALPTFEPKGI